MMGTSGSSEPPGSMQNQQIKDAGSSTAPSPILGGHRLKHTSAASSVAPSPYTSREPSPIRLTERTSSFKSTASEGARPGRYSQQQDASPTFSGKPALPSHGSSRSLASTATPVLLPTPQEPETPTPTPTPRKTTFGSELKDSPRWPVSPRLQSPPPKLNSSSNNNNQPSTAATAPAISLQRATPSPHPSDTQPGVVESDVDEPQNQSGSRTPARGSPSTLETVTEVSLPNSPAADEATALDRIKERLSNEAEKQDVNPAAATDTQMLRARQNLASQSTESGSDGGGSVRAERQRTSSTISIAPSPPPLLQRQSSALSTKQLNGKEELSKHMTVKTETVDIVQQNGLLGSTSGNGTLKTIKTKQSSETIRPRRERRKTNRKIPSVNPMSASSKADNFEAKIANAIDETNTSDSEETFVYDSNPPDRDDRQRRFHSRTPSATSMVSQGGRGNLDVRSIYGVMEGGAGSAMGAKKGNKFLNTLSGNGAESQVGDEDGKSSGRSTAGSARASSRPHNHLSRWGRSHGNGHPSLYDHESALVPTSSRSKMSLSSSRHSSVGPPSPRLHRTMHNGKRSLMQISSTYDLDDAGPADDERTPLMHGSIRSSRSSRSRRPHSHMSVRQLETQSFRQRQSYLNRFAACLVVTIMVFLGITGAIGFMFATSQPMTDIELIGIKNVLASEPELMFDLTLKAHNPNIVVVTIDQADLEIFAKSPHAGTDSEWNKNPEGPPYSLTHNNDDSDLRVLDDPPYDAPDDDSAPNMKLGTIQAFDSPLSFEGSFFNHGWSQSTGEVRLDAPGNSTSGGTTRWGRILENEFDLIVKGVVKYTLPFSNRLRSASVSGRTTVKPNAANDPSLKPNSTLTDG